MADKLESEIELPALIAEIERERELRTRVYPDQVRKGRLAQAEADYRLAVLAAIAVDLARLHEGAAHVPGAIAWTAKLAEIDRELAQRRRLYPEFVAKGRLDQATAARQLAALERIRALYWNHMLAWDPPLGGVPCWNPQRPEYDSAGARLYRQAVRDHMERVLAPAAVQPQLFEQA